LVEVTIRTVQGRFLLKPSLGFSDIVVGALARAQTLYPLRIHALACLSNHLHLLASAKDAQQLSAFMRHFNTNLSKEAARLHDWSGPLLQRRYQAIPVSNEDSIQIARLRYILAQGCKEGLVSRPSDWPGAHCAQALSQGSTLSGIWVNRTAQYNARRNGKSLDSDEFVTRYQLELAPLPCWEGLSTETIQTYIAEMVQQIETETRARHRREGTRPLGLRAIRKQHPHSCPRQSTKSPAPLFHAASRKLRAQLHRAYAAFVESFRAAVERLRRGGNPFGFPKGSFPPPGLFAMPDPVPG
jgi:REP element-mobilizing transposase RayT